MKQKTERELHLPAPAVAAVAVGAYEYGVVWGANVYTPFTLSEKVAGDGFRLSDIFAADLVGN